MTVTVTLLTKTDCSLCDQAKAVLERLVEDCGIDIDLVAVDSSEGAAVAARSGMAFPPGVLIDGEPFSYGRLSERKLRRELERRERRQ